MESIVFVHKLQIRRIVSGVYGFPAPRLLDQLRLFCILTARINKNLELFSRYATEPDFAAARGYQVIRSLLDEN